MNSLGSLLTPISHEQVLAFYEKTSSFKAEQDECIATYESRCEVANTDAQTFQGLGVETSAMADNLFNIVEVAGQNFKQNHHKDSRKESYVDVLHGKFRVYGLDPMKMSFSSEECPLCNHNETGGITYRIINLNTKEEITCQGMTMHLFKKHHYLATGGTYRLEPSRVCKLFE